MIFRDPPADSRLAKLHGEIQAQATAAISQLLVAGAPRAEAELHEFEMLAESVKSAFNGLARWWYEHREVDRSEVIVVAMSLTWLGLDRLTSHAENDGRAADSPANRLSCI